MFLIQKIHSIIKDANESFNGNALSNDRYQNDVDTRVALGHFFYRVMGFTSTKTGEYLNKDHATILHYLRKHREYMRFNKEYKEKYNDFFDKHKPDKPKRWLCRESKFEVKRSIC